MRRGIMGAAWGLLCTGNLLAQGPSSVQQDLIALSNRFGQAQVKKDRAAFEEIIADDYSYIHSNGSVWNKTQEITELMSSSMNWTASKLDNMNARVYGDVGIVTGR